ncbi:MAG: oligosaccharide flippase family protein [Chlorobium sp.]|nr:oligosaccharide flippase family protein [Chlorobium sp.]
MGSNQLKAGVVLSYVSIGLNSIIGLIYTPVMLRYMGQSEYGLYSLGASIIAYLTVLDFGFSNAVIRYTAKYKSIGEIKRLRSIYGLFVILYSVISIIAVIIGFLVLINISHIFGATLTAGELEKLNIIIKLMIFNLIFTFLFGIFGSIITAYQKFIFQKGLNIIRIILNPIVMIVLLMMGYRSIAMVVILTIFNVLTLLISCWYCFYRLKIRISFGTIDINLIKEIILYSVWIFLALIVDKIYWSTGQFVLGVYRGTTEIAVYSIAMQLLMLFVNFSSAISGVFLPKITGMIANKASDESISDLFIKIGRLQFIVVIYILICFVLFGNKFILFWAGKEYANAYYISLILFVPLVVPLIQNIGIQILQAKNKVRFRSVMYMIISIFSLFVTIPLTNKYGVIGTAIGTSIALILGQIIVMNIYYKRMINIDISKFWNEIFKMSLSPLLTGGVFYYTLKIFTIDGYLSLFVAVVCFSVIYFPLVWAISMSEYERTLVSSSLFRIISKR